MGKVKPRLIGDVEVEEKQKKEQKEKAAQKKLSKKKEEPEKKEEVKIEKPKEKKVQRIQVKPRGKRYNENKKILYSSSEVEKNGSRQARTINEAIKILKKMKLSKFDESVELHLVVDETGLKGEVELPYSTGKTVRVAVVDDKILEEIEKGKLNFDILVTHPSFMPKLAKFAKVLGPKGLMPNPKAGTISPKPEEVVKKFAKGVLRWKTEPKAPLIHQMIGKVSNEEKNLVANAEKFIQAVGLKHILKSYIKSTMSPSIKIEVRS